MKIFFTLPILFSRYANARTITENELDANAGQAIAGASLTNKSEAFNELTNGFAWQSGND